MGLVSFFSSMTNKSLVYMSTTDLGQYFIKKIDSFLWTLEKPARYCVDGNDAKFENRKLSWIVFWSLLINLEILRLIVSNISIQCNKGPIESIDVVKRLQRWRRDLRSIRFKGLQTIREADNENANGGGAITYSPPVKQPSEKRFKKDDILNYDLLEELMNRTYSDESDEFDSTFTIGESVDASMNCSGLEDYQSPSKSDVQPLLNDTLPIESANESERQDTGNASSKSSYQSTVEDADRSGFVMTREDSTSSLNEESRTILESSGKLSIGTDSKDGDQTVSGPSKPKRVGKESLNQPVDPADALVSQFVQPKKGGRRSTDMIDQFLQSQKKK